MSIHRAVGELTKVVWMSTLGKIVTIVAGIAVVSATTAVITHHATERTRERSSGATLPAGPTYRVVFPYRMPETADEKFVSERNDVVTYMNWVRAKRTVRDALTMGDLLSSALAGDVTVVKDLLDLRETLDDPLIPYVPREDMPTYQMSQPNYQGTRVSATPVYYQQDAVGRLVLIERANFQGIVLREARDAESRPKNAAEYEKYCDILAEAAAKFTRGRSGRRGTIAATWMATMDDLEALEATLTRISIPLERAAASSELFYGAFYKAGWLVRDGNPKRETSLRTPEEAASAFLYGLYLSDESMLRTVLGRGRQEEGFGEDLRRRHWPWDEKKTPRELILEGVEEIEDGHVLLHYFGMLPPLGKDVPRSGYDIGYGGTIELYRDSRCNWRVGKTQEMLAAEKRVESADAQVLRETVCKFLVAVYRDKSDVAVRSFCTSQMAGYASALRQGMLPAASTDVVFYVTGDGYLFWESGGSLGSQLFLFRKEADGKWLLAGSGSGSLASYKERAIKILLGPLLDPDRDRIVGQPRQRTQDLKSIPRADLVATLDWAHISNRNELDTFLTEIARTEVKALHMSVIGRPVYGGARKLAEDLAAQRYGNTFDRLLSRDGLLLDPWGNPVIYYRNKNMRVAVTYSMGPNEKDDGAGGDDVVASYP